MVKINQNKPTDNSLFTLLKAKRVIRAMNAVLVSTEIGRPSSDSGSETIFLRWLNHAKC